MAGYAHRLGELFHTLDNAEKESLAMEKKAKEEKMLAALPAGEGEKEKLRKRRFGSIKSPSVLPNLTVLRAFYSKTCP